MIWKIKFNFIPIAHIINKLYVLKVSVYGKFFTFCNY